MRTYKATSKYCYRYDGGGVVLIKGSQSLLFQAGDDSTPILELIHGDCSDEVKDRCFDEYFFEDHSDDDESEM